ncbi:MAG TPA: GyrI-like domain-containing protein [Candidatus Dormibacteraeota bacterium]|nr:GyrI-like domain-containing protein [Candidatus Dormibacteraeota bacterium]
MAVMKIAPKTIVKTDRESVYKARSGEPEMVRVPEMTFLMIDGRGDPNTTQEYKDSIAALYTLSYAFKFALKKERGLDFRVGPLEGQFWAKEMSVFADRKADWLWTMMIAQPDQMTPQRFAKTLEEVRRKKELLGLDRIRLERFNEGLCAQLLHIGPYSAEGPNIEKLHAFIRTEGYTFDGRKQKHHEIYMSDPRRTVPPKWKTIIRQPVVLS